jgi:para-aminobenzoate synthetase component 1
VPWLDKKEGFETISRLGKAQTPFLFIISYEQNQILAQPLEGLDKDIYYQLESHQNYTRESHHKKYSLLKYPLDFMSYKNALNTVLEQISLGNTYLLNLTFKTAIETNASLKEIFMRANAKYKLYYKDEFICFSPECFVTIEGDTIATYPMKGTIDANSPEAKLSILNDPKEMAEHIMIVDLMRNDLGMIGSKVKVEAFRYVEKIEAGEKELLQVSSKITAILDNEWREDIGKLLESILPAGSITGTPKQSTIDIIASVEKSPRGFYTGIFGLFDGASLYSSVIIRFISKEKEKLYYQSGGGITIDSDAKSEYEELINKVYLPFKSDEDKIT